MTTLKIKSNGYEIVLKASNAYMIAVKYFQTQTINIDSWELDINCNSKWNDFQKLRRVTGDAGINAEAYLYSSLLQYLN